MQYGTEARAQLTDTIFLADLDHDGMQEPIVINTSLWEQESVALLAVYQDDGTVLYSADLSAPHAGWDNYFLSQGWGRLSAAIHTLYGPGLCRL